MAFCPKEFQIGTLPASVRIDPFTVISGNYNGSESDILSHADGHKIAAVPLFAHVCRNENAAVLECAAMVAEGHGAENTARELRAIAAEMREATKAANPEPAQSKSAYVGARGGCPGLTRDNY
jgi:hypothetical protein